MAGKQDFDAVEWDTIAQAPAIAGLMVMTAQRGGTIRESVAMASAYKAALVQGSEGILGAIVEKPPEISPREFSSREDLNAKGADRIRSAVELLESKGATADEVDAYKDFTLTVANQAAEADKSGGFLGVGGERVSDAERAALDRIREALGLKPEPAP
jgi:hypothetical protein